MKRIYMGMALWGFLFILGAILLGATTADDRLAEGRHMQAGLFTAFYIIMLHCVVFVHLLGTGLGVKRALFEHRLPQEEFVRRLWRCKMLAYPAAFLCMVLTIMTAVAGGGAQRENLPDAIHGSLAVILLIANVLTVPLELRMIDENSAVMAEVEELIEQSKPDAEKTPPSTQNEASEVKEAKELGSHP